MWAQSMYRLFCWQNHRYSLFQFDGFIDLDAYDTIAMKLRGDGRCYISTVWIRFLSHFWIFDVRCIVNMMLHNLNFEYRYTQRTGLIHLDKNKITRGRHLCTYPRTDGKSWRYLKFTAIQNWELCEKMTMTHRLPFLSDPSWSIFTYMERKCDPSKVGDEPCSYHGDVSLCKRRRWCSWCQDWARWF
jgi:hypothetical protein